MVGKILLALASAAAVFGIVSARKVAEAAPMAPSPGAAQAALATTPDLQFMADVIMRLISGKASVRPTSADISRALEVAQARNLKETGESIQNGFRTWPQSEVWPNTNTLATQFLTALWGQSPYRALTA